MTDDSLNWLAMQYVLDELPAPDRALFEERLANDLVACEAVAAASQLRLGLEQAFDASEPPVMLQRNPASRGRRSQIAVAVVGMTLACGLFAALFGPSFGPDHDRTPNQRQMNVQTPNQLNAVASEQVAMISMWTSGMAEDEADLNEIEDESQETAVDESIPSWLLAGVSLEMNEPN